MNEVNGTTVELLADTLAQRGLDPAVVLAGLPSSRGERVDWELWVELIARVEAQVGANALEDLFVPGGGLRTKNRFVYLASGFLSVRDVYALFARWGLRRGLLVCTGTVVWAGDRRARLTIEIDPTRRGSLPTLRYIAGILRHMSSLQGLPSTRVTVQPEATPHRAVYELELPIERSLVARARRVVRVVGGVGAALDELEQQAAEIASKNAELSRQLEEAKEHDAWLGLALDAGRVGTWRWDPATSRVRISAKLAEMLALDRPARNFEASAWSAGAALGDVQELATHAWGELIHPDDRARVIAVVGGAVKKSEPFEVEYRVLRPIGEPGWLRVTGRLVLDHETRREHVFGTAVDVTEQRQVDGQLRLADRLIAAGTLAAGVAHEINNPLTYVLGNLELAQRRLRAHPEAAALIKDSFGQIHEGLERIRDVVADLRAFARPEEDVIGRLDLKAVCDGAIRLVSSLVRHRAELVTAYDPDVPTVLANESRLGQVVINLVINASHAMPERSAVESRITVRTRVLPTGEAAIEVEDNGTGIAPEVLPRLFDPFFTTKEVGVGTGLGLSVCQSIVASMRGRIDVDTALGRGTTFTVVLPAAPAVVVTTEPPKRPPSPVTGMHVLVIDDEPLVRRTLARMLRTHGVSVTEADGGITGLELVETAGPFDAVLCDLMMPDLDGASLHDELVRRKSEVAQRMVFISGGTVTERTRAFADRPEIVLLPKPFAVDTLLGALAAAGRR